MLKKLVTIIMVTIMSFVGIVPMYINVDASETIEYKGIKIDEKQFPCAIIREKIEQNIDEDKNGYLSENEISTVVTFGIDAAELQDEETNDVQGLFTNDNGLERKISKKEEYKRYCIIDCKGIEIFKNIKKITISLGGIAGYHSRIKNLNIISKLPKLETLCLRGDCCVKNYDFSKLKSLKRLSLLECERIKSIKFGKNSKIEVLDLSSSSGNGNIDVSSLKKLKKFKAEFTQLKRITFGNNKRLTNICILGDPSNTNKKIESLDFSKVKNLKKLKISSLDKLISVKLGQKKKLKSLTIIFCKKLKKVNLERCNIPKNASIDIGL